MSTDLFYNRDRNISGVTAPAELSGLLLTPTYGSRASFSATNYSYTTDDFYYNLIPLSENSLTVNFGVKYATNETDARKLANFFESKSGYVQAQFTPDNSGIYKTVSGVCDNYAVNFINNQHFEVAAEIFVERAPNLFNWSGQTFTNLPFQEWSSSVSYQKYDVAYTGVNTNKLNNFYYCTGDHTSSVANSPTGDSSMWTQSFFFDSDLGIQSSVNIKADKLNYKNSFTQRFKTDDNISTFDISYNFSSITDKQLRCMLHFLENKGGYRRFRNQIPAVYNRPKVYYCPEWQHTWNYHNSNDLSVSLVEDPLGVLPTGT
jgi:phage-related protein|tara:strand:- start:1722 stop:2675 length:954 start_codon:yes stop_codon:yes gene_type:complete